MTMAASECLIAVRHASRSGGRNVSSSSTDVRPLSASGFFFRSFIVSSASWLASLVDIKLDSSARSGAGGGAAITWSWKLHPHTEFVILYQVLHVHIASLGGGCHAYTHLASHCMYFSLGDHLTAGDCISQHSMTDFYPHPSPLFPTLSPTTPSRCV